jgi:hypothetical protein
MATCGAERLSLRSAPKVAAWCLVATLLALSATPADAQWKWRDKDGRVTVSDLPPPRDVAEKDILQRPAAAPARRPAPVAAAPAAPAVAGGGDLAGTAAPGAAPGVAPPPGAGAAAPAPTAASAAAARPPAPAPADKELEARRRAAAQAEAAKAKAEEEKVAAQRAENCRRARQHLATIESGQRLARINERGEREVLDDRIRAEETRRAREVIASECRA